MATNIVFDPGYNISVVVDNPATPSSNDPIRFGSITGIAITDEGAGGNESDETSVNFGPFIANFDVDADSGDIDVGDPVYYVDTPTGSPATNLNDDSSGTFFGIALEAVSSGNTTEIQVMHMPVAGGSVLASNSVGTSQIAAGAVTAAKLNGALGIGFIPLPLASWNDIQNLAAHGGILAKDSTPILEYINGDTDSAIRMNWVATDVAAVAIQVPLPPDLDTSADVELHFRAAMSASNEGVTVNLDTFFNEGDTKVEDSQTVAIGTTYNERTITIAAADVPSGAQTMSMEITPGAHGTDGLFITAFWIEYTRTE
jgi:hypothetical protein